MNRERVEVKIKFEIAISKPESVESILNANIKYEREQKEEYVERFNLVKKDFETYKIKAKSLLTVSNNNSVRIEDSDRIVFLLFSLDI